MNNDDVPTELVLLAGLTVLVVAIALSWWLAAGVVALAGSAWCLVWLWDSIVADKPKPTHNFHRLFYP